jgi:hypothetical protein
MNRRRLPFDGLGIFVQEASDITEELIEHIVFSFHGFLSVRSSRKSPIAWDAMGP